MEEHVKKFDIGEAIRFGWNTVRANLGLFLGLAAILFVVTGGVGGILHLVPGLGGIVSWLLSLVVMMGLIRIVLKFVDGGAGSFNDLFANFDMLLDYIGASILYALIVIGGLCLLIFPGIIWAIKFGFYGYFIIDRKTGAIDALKRSSAATQGSKGQLFVFGLVVFALNLLGLLCLGIGILITQPVSLLAQGFVYRKLQQQVSEAVSAGDPPKN
jgi:uncharacterized membrane protein